MHFFNINTLYWVHTCIGMNGGSRISGDFCFHPFVSVFLNLSRPTGMCRPLYNNAKLFNITNKRYLFKYWRHIVCHIFHHNTTYIVHLPYTPIWRFSIYTSNHSSWSVTNWLKSTINMYKNEFSYTHSFS